MEDVTNRESKHCNERNTTQNKTERRKETEYTMRFATLWYCMYGRAVELTANVRFFFCRRHVSSRAPVVIRVSLRVVVHGRTDARQTPFFFFARPPTICTPANTHCPCSALLNPNSPVKPPGSRHLLPQTIPRVPARLTPSKLRREPAPHTHTYIQQSIGVSRQFQLFRHIKQPRPRP